MHRKAHHRSGQPLRDGYAGTGDRIVAKGRLARQRARVVDLCRNALTPERPGYIVAKSICDPHRILCTHRRSTLGEHWHRHVIRKCARIPGCNLISRMNFIWKNLELLNQDGGLKCVEPSVDTDAHDVVFAGTFAMAAN